MIAVIQCAASKRSSAGYLLSPDGRRIVFVADPLAAPADDTVVYARPDDLSGGVPWRDALVEYNKTKRDNPLDLFPAWQLYDNGVYGRLVDKLGVENVYILSAGWGLIPADFLTPYYDITFSSSARNEDSYKRRRKADRYQDLRMLPDETRDDVVFFGGKDYLLLFCDLTAAIRGRKTVFYNSGKIPSARGCVLRLFETTRRTNWQYECANAFLDGAIGIDASSVGDTHRFGTDR